MYLNETVNGQVPYVLEKEGNSNGFLTTGFLVLILLLLALAFISMSKKHEAVATPSSELSAILPALMIANAAKQPIEQVVTNDSFNGSYGGAVTNFDLFQQGTMNDRDIILGTAGTQKEILRESCATREKAAEQFYQLTIQNNENTHKILDGQKDLLIQGERQYSRQLEKTLDQQERLLVSANSQIANLTTFSALQDQINAFKTDISTTLAYLPKRPELCVPVEFSGPSLRSITTAAPVPKQ